MSKLVLIHGKDATPHSKWYPWFKSAAEHAGVSCVIPELPHPEAPVLEEWVNVIEATKPDEDTILVGHSRGGVAILRFLEQAPLQLQVRKVILIATNSGFLHKRAIPNESNSGFYTQAGYDYEMIQRHATEFVVMHSIDDTWVPFDHGEEIASGLKSRFLVFSSYGHFGKGVTEIPELLKEVLI